MASSQERNIEVVVDGITKIFGDSVKISDPESLETLKMLLKMYGDQERANGANQQVQASAEQTLAFLGQH